MGKIEAGRHPPGGDARAEGRGGPVAEMTMGTTVPIEYAALTSK